jgi:hypothetical protein
MTHLAVPRVKNWSNFLYSFRINLQQVSIYIVFIKRKSWARKSTFILRTLFLLGNWHSHFYFSPPLKLLNSSQSLNILHADISICSFLNETPSSHRRSWAKNSHKSTTIKFRRVKKDFTWPSGFDCPSWLKMISFCIIKSVQHTVRLSLAWITPVCLSPSPPNI